MAENIPNLPGGAVPPKPAEAAKVQPKKETVRINLPPKPTAAPTIKIPSPAAISAAAPAAAAPVAVPAGGVAAPVAAGPAPSAAAPTAVPAKSAVAAVPAAPSRPAPAARTAVVSAIGPVDKGLAIAVAVASLAALVRIIMLGGS